MNQRRTRRFRTAWMVLLSLAVGALPGVAPAQADEPRVPAQPVQFRARQRERYEAAGAARRAAGVETWMFIHPTWINWHPEKYTGPYARELLDGYLLIMLERKDCLPADGAMAARHISRAGMKFIPGMRLGADKAYAEWTRPETWEKDLAFYRQIGRVFQLGSGAPLAVDMEPYWEGKRYPRPEDVYAMAEAMGEWREIAEKTPMWILPGGVHYWNSWLMASWRAPHGPVYVLDEATYDREKGDQKKLEEMIRQRKGLMESLGMTYVPGFYLRHAMDPGLYEMLKKLEIKQCWFYAQAVPDEYNRFGTLAWKHAQ